MTVKLYQGDCLDVLKRLPDGSVDAVVTDPPYPKEFEHLYEAMAVEASRLLRRGGSLVFLCGHYQLHRVLPAVAKHLKYRWLINYDQPGSHARMAMGVLVTWKPMAWFVKDALSPLRNITDRVTAMRSKVTGHPWEQGIEYASWACEHLTDEGETILDPFMGSGTTGVACLRTGRRFIGVEIDPGYFQIAKDRIAAERRLLRRKERVAA